MKACRGAAKRVREAKRKDRATSASVAEDEQAAKTNVDAGAIESNLDELQRLRHQVKQLTDENQQLRKQVATLLERELSRSGGVS